MGKYSSIRENLLLEILEFPEISKKIFSKIPFLGEDFCKSLRKQIWGVALGISPTDAILEQSPESANFFKTVWMKTAADNSAIYWDTFRTLPNNAVASYLDETDASYQKWKKERDDQKSTLTTDDKIKKLSSIQGTIILHQDQFAIKDDQIVPASQANQPGRFILRTTKPSINNQFNTFMRHL